MGPGLGDGLYLPGRSPLHRLAPQCKIAACVLFAFAVVAAPREAFWAYACFAVLVLAVAHLAGVPIGVLGRRLAIELPFVAFALFLPFVGTGERVDVAGVGLSVDGLWGAWNILAKGTLGVAASIVLASTTPVPDLLRGLERLRAPAVFTTVATFMVRYGDVVSAEMRRMQVARLSRGHEANSLRSWRVLATSAGALFIRAYERGERVHLAMLSRGFDGRVPGAVQRAAGPAEWSAALVLPLAAGLVSALSWGLR
jgi:cobalt/nickel transport system permease protein